MVGRNEDPTAFFRFWERLQQNPSYRSVNQLWAFLNNQGIPLTANGNFLAYKGVQQDYKDVHTSTYDNSPGAINEMPRNKISDDPHKSCHDGFHVGALEYAKNFSSRVVICEVDPKDVVCVPYDSSQQKMRVCKYRVIGNYGSQLDDAVEDVSDSSALNVHSGAPVATEEDGGQTILRKTSPVIPTDDPTRPEDFKALDKMGVVQLLDQPIGPLRTYASRGLNIVGASKIPGGKTALIQAIVKARDIG